MPWACRMYTVTSNMPNRSSIVLFVSLVSLIDQIDRTWVV